METGTRMGGNTLGCLILALLLPTLAHAAPERPAGEPGVRARPQQPLPRPRKRPVPKLSTNAREWVRYQGRLVKSIHASGLKRTREWRLREMLDTRVGKPFDADTFGHDLRRIRNLELFRDLRVRVDPDGEGVKIRFQMADKWSLLPFFNAFFNLGSVNVITGVYDVNTLGTLSYVDLQLLLFSYLPLTADSIRPGGKINLGIDRLRGFPLDYYLSARAQTSIHTIVGSRGTAAGSFLSSYYGGYQSLTWQPFQWLGVGITQQLFWQTYRVATGAEAPLVPTPGTGLTHAWGATVRLGYLRYQNYLMHGIKLNVAVDGAAGWLGSDSDLVRIYGEFLAFYRFGPRGGNLAGRIKAGYMKGGRYGDLFALGSWTGLRGFYTGQFRARAYVVGNLEYRTGLLRTGFPIASIIPYFRGKVFQIQGAVFVDTGALAGAGPYRTDESGQLLMSIGAGLRLAAINLYRAIFRLDFAYTVSPYRSFDFIISTQQFF